jgi:hypothetical protein
MNRLAICLVAVFLLSTATRAPGQEKEAKLPEDVQSAQKLIQDHLATLKNGRTDLIIIDWLKQEPLEKTFPNHYFFAVRYRIYGPFSPREGAYKPPEGFGPSNVFAVAKDAKLPNKERLIRIKGSDKIQIKAGKTDLSGLKDFFVKNLAAVKDEKAGKNAVKVALLLGQEFYQDNYYTKFNIQDDSIKFDMNKGAGTAVVTGGGTGELRLQLVFDDAGKLSGVNDVGTKIRRGSRPKS